MNNEKLTIYLPSELLNEFSKIARNQQLSPTAYAKKLISKVVEVSK